ncbi:hypothetical protein QN277_018931 [Acacia crassicarpa]|uniref:Uncharacterized protein n=1 Tax=Acacia crassicarpa TaxID=499986 RepID=A0AAE1MUZ6_9FABA|nr:hypothetical protein QN277_018931 [Acacia crassicarpa]
MFRSSESLSIRISDGSAGASDHSNGFTSPTMVPREDNEPKKVTQTFNALMEPSPMFSSSHIGAGCCSTNCSEEKPLLRGQNVG